mmetsp:Transcript_5603/g.8838  ORF Transcript_5603/g.8838 Transcript_5603/m.8838 type:complete len:160 (-) Transcript_5603:5688-6167(-)
MSYTVAMTLVADCSLDAITMPANTFVTETGTSLAYTIVDETLTDVFNAFTTVNPTLCALEYFLKVGTDDITASAIAGMVTFDDATLQIDIFYDGNNEFGGNTYTITLEARYVLATSTTQSRDMTLVVTKNCEYATLVAPTGSTTVHSYTVSDKGTGNYR